MTCATFSPRFLATMEQLIVAVMSSTTSTTCAGCPSNSRSKASMMEAATCEWSCPVTPRQASGFLIERSEKSEASRLVSSCGPV